MLMNRHEEWTKVMLLTAESRSKRKMAFANDTLRIEYEPKTVEMQQQRQIKGTLKDAT